MKYLYLSISLAIFSVFFIGCNTSTSPTTTPASMNATVNGASWSSVVVPGITGVTKANKNGNILTVTGVQASDNTEITIEIMNPTLGADSLGVSGDVGTYSKVVGVSDTNAFISTPTLSSLSAGAVTVTAYDTVHKTISGTFHFVGRLATNLSDTVIITNGSFYQVGW